MQKIYKKIIPLFFLVTTLCLLLFLPSNTLNYAKKGLSIWYQNMVPALFPMMIITSCMIKLNVTTTFAAFLHPITKKIYHVTPNGTYALFIGFLCGFPMGAKVICELYSYKKISVKEANILLPICNNIGPIFLITYGFKPFVKHNFYLMLFLFYAIPLVYAIFLCKKKHFMTGQEPFTTHKSSAFSVALDEAIADSAAGILSLGGYLMFFSILTMITFKLLPVPETISIFLTCLLEITNGLSCEPILSPYIFLALLQFGGICCIFQTLKYTSNTNLNFRYYLKHKVILSVITLLVFYVVDIFFGDVFFFA